MVWKLKAKTEVVPILMVLALHSTIVQICNNSSNLGFLQKKRYSGTDPKVCDLTQWSQQRLDSELLENLLLLWSQQKAGVLGWLPKQWQGDGSYHWINLWQFEHIFDANHTGPCLCFPSESASCKQSQVHPSHSIFPFTNQIIGNFSSSPSNNYAFSNSQ